SAAPRGAAGTWPGRRRRRIDAGLSRGAAPTRLRPEPDRHAGIGRDKRTWIGPPLDPGARARALLFLRVVFATNLVHAGFQRDADQHAEETATDGAEGHGEDKEAIRVAFLPAALRRVDAVAGPGKNAEQHAAADQRRLAEDILEEANRAADAIDEQRE